jgi:chemotaxis protein CheY-P-specific phosphatase CheC
MHTKAGQILERIAVASLEKCVAKLSRISAGKWSVADARVSWRSMEEATREHSRGPRGTGAATYFEVKGEYPFTSMVVFRPEDIEIISKGFLGFSFSKLPSLNQAQELLLSELGNIILNSLLSSLSNTLKRAFLPTAPKCVQGETRFLLEALWTATDPAGRHSLVTVMLDLQCDGTVTHIEVVALIPDNMERALTAAYDGKTDGE